jgi:choline dehydrogenase
MSELSISSKTKQSKGREPREPPRIFWDYIIVGCGAAGSILAARLAENSNIKILILELGQNNFEVDPLSYLIDTPILSSNLSRATYQGQPTPSHLNFETTAQNGRIYLYPRGNGAGGSTNHSAMVDGRGSRIFYDNIAKQVDDNLWSYCNVLHYFKKMESYNVETNKSPFHGQNGWLDVKHGTLENDFHTRLIKVATQNFNIPSQFDFSGDPTNVAGIGWGDMQVSPDGIRSYGYRNLLYPKLKQKNLKLIFGALVSKILFNDNRAIGVEAILEPYIYKADTTGGLDPPSRHNPNPNIKRFYGNKIYLCCGAIQTPQLLMLSGIGPRKHLESLGIEVRKNCNGVGSDLMDHTEVSLVHELNPEKIMWRWQATSLGIPRFSQYSNPESFEENGSPVMLDWFSDKISNPIDPDFHGHSIISFFYDFGFDSPEPLPDGKTRQYYINSQFDPINPKVYHSFLTETLKLYKANGTIRLKSKDPTEPPLINLGLWEDIKAISHMAKSIILFRKIMANQELSSFVIKEVFPGPQYETEEQLIQYIQKFSSFGHHISGTAKMGKCDDPSAVVDSRLNVIGFEGLKIADTSIFPFPNIPGYNTSRHAYVVGEIAADIEKHKALHNECKQICYDLFNPLSYK